MTGSNGLLFSKESLEARMNSLTESEALRMVGLAGGKGNLEKLVRALARNFNANVSEKAFEVIANASRRFRSVNGSPMINYAVAA